MLRSFFRYYGGKTSSAKLYPPPSYPTIIEPFAGSAGYSLMYPDRRVTLNDLDPNICTLWDYLIHVSETEILGLPTNVFVDVRLLRCCEEAKILIGFWCDKGQASPSKSPCNWMRCGGREKSFWGDHVKRRIASQIQYIRHWKILCSSYSELDNHRSTWFVDPPYDNSAGRAYRMHDVDYDDLGSWCRSRSGHVIVCENQGATWLPFRELYVRKKSQTNRGSGSIEMIYQKGRVL